MRLNHAGTVIVPVRLWEQAFSHDTATGHHGEGDCHDAERIVAAGRRAAFQATAVAAMAAAAAVSIAARSPG